MEKHPHQGHRDRIRARYYTSGLESFHDHEVLELLLYYCYPRGDTNPKAHQMLGEFGSLHNLFEADIETLTQRLNCTENIALLLNLIPALANRYFRSKWSSKVTLDSETATAKFAMDLCIGHTVERFYVLSLDNRQRLINTTLISKGTVDEAAVYPREVIRVAIQDKVTGVILAHNHPGGSMKPSRADLEVTRQIVDGLSFIGVTVIDHIIVAGDTYYSFAARGQHVTGYS
ncbi:MAG: DNA repair protein RadC [Defluviitaleaceae bacterium]|nr:DNA repair protein RadC [Defluviitaleaceae bacterium]